MRLGVMDGVIIEETDRGDYVPRGNRENLIAGNERSQEEAIKNGRKGGQASGEARRKKKLLSEYLDIYLAKQPAPEITDELLLMGVDPEDVDNAMAMAIAIGQKAQSGDTKAFEVIRDTIGQKPIEKVEVSKPTTETVQEIEKYVNEAESK